MAWSLLAIPGAGTIATIAGWATKVVNNFRYLKGIDGVVTTQSGLIVDNSLGTEYVKLPLLSTAEVAAALVAEGQVAHDEATHRIKVFDGTAVRSVVTTADVDDTPTNAATTDPISSNWAFDLLNILTTSQDIPIASDAGVWTKLAKGTANQFLKMAADASTVGWSTVTPTSSKLKAHTRALNANAGDVAYTGYGFQPKTLIIIQYMSGAFFGLGCGDSALAEMNAYISETGGHVTVGGSSSYIVYAIPGNSGVGESAVLKTLDADGFTLTWALIGEGYADTLNMIVLAMA